MPKSWTFRCLETTTPKEKKNIFKALFPVGKILIYELYIKIVVKMIKFCCCSINRCSESCLNYMMGNWVTKRLRALLQRPSTLEELESNRNAISRENWDTHYPPCARARSALCGGLPRSHRKVPYWTSLQI